MHGIGRSGLLQSGRRNPSLGEMSQLEQSMTVSVNRGVATSDKHCVVNQGSALAALVLTDNARRPVQTLFYQLTLYRLCGSGPVARVRLCNATPQKVTWFFSQNPFGVADFLPLAGQKFLRAGEVRQLRINLLPRLRDVIAHAPKTMDHNLNHWKVGGVYIGQNIWGDVVLQSRWSGYRLVAITK
ncbi:hypothetical protein [Acidiphilium sp.]|uniref:hypothetical protein n=1 Tax=Acidiphilium sp. TaxID=527 RepID=UPI003D039920